jgi:hypothetical protein
MALLSCPTRVFAASRKKRKSMVEVLVILRSQPRIVIALFQLAFGLLDIFRLQVNDLSVAFDHRWDTCSLVLE